MPAHTPAFILAECHVAGRTGIFLLHHHALDQMKARNIDRDDIRHALTGATLATYQSDTRTWKVTGGSDCEGVALNAALVFERGILVITVF